MYSIDNVKMWTGDMEVEQAAMDQLRNISVLPILAGHVAVMPDVHMGKGATVGSVIPTRSAIIPAAVGVDIGCGMCAVMTNLTASDLPESLYSLRNSIERGVPVGFNEHSRSSIKVKGAAADKLRQAEHKMFQRWEKLAMKERLGRADPYKIANQIGTLGGGNHFIEICLDLEDRVWVMLHSGSRGIGNQIGTVAIEMAKEIAIREQRKLVDSDLAWLDEGTAEFNAYIEAMLWAQDYAMLNRDTMMQIVLQTLQHKFPQMKVVGEVVNCHHNFTSIEEHFGEDMWITRKGAVSAKEGQMGIIPGSMGAKSFIVQGKGNQDSYCSCSHGAGRKYSRNGAKRMFSLDDLELQTAGVECRKDENVLDEIPGAYKDIDAVMAAQTDLVEIVHTLKQVLCVKG
jgi:tRNA-splicing ligase RtcB (3'-phosphate/5'-hydroxy nucleic acid ligase)